MDQVFKGYEAKSAVNTGAAQWWKVLQVPSNANWEAVKAAYRQLVKTAHPDCGGDRAQWDQLQAAYQQAKEVFNVD